MFTPMTLLIAHPWLALPVAAAFALLWLLRRGALAALAALLWALYAGYET